MPNNKRDERTYLYISEAVKLIASVDIDAENPNADKQEILRRAAKRCVDAWRDNQFEVWGKLAGMQTNPPHEIIPVGYSLDEDVEFDYFNDKIRVPALPTSRGLSPHEKIWEKVKVKRNYFEVLADKFVGSDNVKKKKKKPAAKAQRIAEEMRSLSKLPEVITKEMERSYCADRKTIEKARTIIETQRSKENAG